jgi:heat shock protein HtpX
VLHQIAHNKRMSAVVVVIFMTIWLLIGFLAGLLTRSLAGAITGAVLLAFLALLGAVFSYYFGGATVLAVSGAKPADPQQYPELNHVVEALTIGAGLTTRPAVYVIDDPSPNAFATGRDPAHAAVTATTGLLQMMNREELEGVLAHEISHIRNYDVRLVLVVSTLVAMAGLLGSWLLRATFTGGRRDRDSGGAMLVVLALALLLMLFGFLFGPLLQFALSRERESLADVSGVELTRNPAGLLSALQKLAANDQPLKNWNAATAPMYIDDPLQHHEHWFNHLFDTHPPIQERIAALRQIMDVKQT